MPTRAFISYKSSDAARNSWVESLYEDLRRLGIDAVLDTYDVAPGTSFSDYMTRGVQKSDVVLVVITPEAVKAVDAGTGPFAFEVRIANAHRLAATPDSRPTGFIIPILREGDAVPTHVSDDRYMDFRDDSLYAERLRELVRWLKGEVRRPRLGWFDSKSAQSIRKTLQLRGTMTILGLALDHPRDGQPGHIQLADAANEDCVLEYLRQADNDDWDFPWHKQFYSWTIQWVGDDAVVLATSRFANSPK